MASIALKRSDVIVGVDTHKEQHVAVALDGLGGVVEDRMIVATDDGYAELVTWAVGLGRPVAFGVEGCGSYGIGLARFLRRHGHQVIEVTRPPRKGERRLEGKNDLIDARHAASEVLAGRATATPKSAGGMIESIRLVKIVRDTAVKTRATTMVTLKAVLVTAADELRRELEPLSDVRLITACAALGGNDDLIDPNDAMRYTLGALARRWLELHTEIKIHTRQLTTLTTQAAPELVAAFGIGPDIAAALLVAAGDNTDRVHSEAAFAKLCGSCPIPTGTGKTNGRHRLNRGGNRQANAALYRCVIVRMRYHAPTIAYVERRTTEGLSKKEIIRCLKRYVAREVYALLPTPTTVATPQTSRIRT
jgi:transposase